MTNTEPAETQAPASPAVTSRDAMAYRRSMGLAALAATLFAFYLGLLPFIFAGADLGEVVARLVASARNLTPGDRGGGLVGHATAMAIIAFLGTGALSYRRSIVVTLLAAVLALAVVAGIGILIEIAQGFTRFRNVSAGDAAAGILGGGIGTLAWLVAGNRIVGVAHGLRGGSLKPLRSALTLYAVAYVLLSFFPYDFTLSPANWVERFSATRLLGAEGTGHAFNLLASFLGALPLGIFLGLRVTPRGRRFWLAVIIGFGIELLQGFQATGHVVLMAGVARAAGMALGAHWADTRIAVDRLRRSDARLALGGVIVIYLLLLTVASGWYRGDMPAWEGVRWSLAHTSYLPFFYHAVEADLPAVVSLIFVAAAYGVAGLLWRLADHAWLRGTRGLVVALAGGLLAAGMEFGGLVFAGQRMDPSSVVIALVVMPVAYRITDRILTAMGGTNGPQGDAGLAVAGRADRLPRGNATAGQPRWKGAVAGLAVVATLLFVIDFPVANLWLAVLFAGYAALLWRYPDAWLVVLPSAIPVLDLAPWSGRFFLTEFDMLILITVAVGLLRTAKADPALRLGRVARWWIVLMTVSYGVSLIVGLIPLSPLDANTFSNYYSSFNGLRVAKGYFEALVLLPFLLRALRNNPHSVLLLTGGMLVGLMLNGLVILRERHLLTGIFWFASDYRATGLFSSMHTGGAYLEAYMVAAAPFIVVPLLLRRRVMWAGFSLAVLAAVVYGVAATASRSPLAILAVTFLILSIGLLVAARRRGSLALRLGLITVGAAVLAGGIALPLMSEGSFLRQRFERISADSQVRLDHWKASVEMMDDGLPSRLFGMGLGAYPVTYFWSSPAEERPASYRFERDGERGLHLRLGSGRPLYFSQSVAVEPSTDYVFSVRLRKSGDVRAATFFVCEKWLISSWSCEKRNMALAGDGEWREVRVPFNSASVGAARGRMGELSRRPVKLSLFNPGPRGTLDIDDVRLIGPDGRSLVENGDFSQGMDHWFFTVDQYLPWHAHNMLLHVFVEQGWLGLLGFIGLGAAAVLGLGRGIVSGDRFSAVLLSSLIAIWLVGIIDSLLDDPRITFFYFLILFTALATGALARESGAAGRAAPGNSST